MRKKNRSRIDQALDRLVKASQKAHQAIARNAKLSNRYTAAQRRAIQGGDEAGRRLAKKLFDCK